MNRFPVLYVLVLAVALVGCEAQGDYPGLEYAPQMYHTTPYEPLTQITDTDEGAWLSSLDNGVGEFYNSNPYNPYAMNSRVPPANTVKRNPNDFLPYRIHPDSIELAARILKNPVDSTEAVLEQGEYLYTQFCYPCHGTGGQGDGPVGKVYLGVPAYNKGRYVDMTEGHIFHTITWGRGRMNAHGSQMDIADRWKIVRYVQTLQQQ